MTGFAEVSNPLGRLLGPIDIGTFVRDYWNRSPCYVPGEPARFDWMDFDPDQFFELAASTSDDAPALKAGRVDRDGRHVEMAPARHEAKAAFDDGATLCLAGLERSHERILQLSRGLRLALGVDRVVVNSYLSPEDGGFGLHFDNHSVLVLQVAGSKGWRFSSAPAVAFPPVNAVWSNGEVDGEWPSGLDLDKPEDEAFVAVELRPGDTLYMPPGTWHQARATGRWSLHLALGFSRLSAHEVVAEALESAVERELLRPEVREFLPAARGRRRLFEPDESRGRKLLASALEDARDLLERMTIQDLERRWLDRVYRKTEPLPHPQAPSELSDTHKLAWHPEVPLRFASVRDGDGDPVLRLYLPGCVLHLPAEAGSLLERLAVDARFSYAEVHASAAGASDVYTWNDVAPILGKLLEAGLLRRSAAT